MKTKKGDDKMEHKDIWLVIGLTVILAVAVTVSTVSITGNAVFGTKQLTADMLNKAITLKSVSGFLTSCDDMCKTQRRQCIYSEEIEFNPNSNDVAYVSQLACSGKKSNNANELNCRCI